MLSKLLRSRRSAQRPQASIPPGKRVYAIGDIHGCDALLERLIANIDADDAARDPVETTLVFLGDLVDRGPKSAAVIERLHRLVQARTHVHILKGNHEEVFLAAVAGDAKAVKLFCRIGGRETILSYGVDPVAYEGMDYAKVAATLVNVVPESHITFLTGFEDMVIMGDYAFVHAGIRPGIALDRQDLQDLRWIRDPFLDHGRPLSKVIVHGHTIVERPEFRTHRIGVDTGAYETGRLTALGLEADRTWLVEATSRRSDDRDG